MAHVFSSQDCLYPNDDAFEYEPLLLRLKLRHHTDRNELRGPGLLAAVAPFLADPKSPTACQAAKVTIQSLIRDAWEAGRFVLFDRRSLDGRCHRKLLILDEWGNGWFFVKDDRRHDTYKFDTVFYRGSLRSSCPPDAAESLERAAVLYRNRLVGHASHAAGDGEWSDFEFGWAAFWRAEGQPPVPRSKSNPLES